LKSYLREYDTIAKLESDKFGVLLKDIKNEEDIFTILAKLFEKLSRPYTIDDKIISLSFNAGISIYPKDAEDPEILIDRAGIALINNRHKGEGGFGFYEKKFQERAQKQIKLKNEMLKALHRKEFVLYYQPYFDANTSRIKGGRSPAKVEKRQQNYPPLWSSYLILKKQE